MVRIAFAVVATVVLVACSQILGVGSGDYECGGLSLTAEELETAPPANELPAEARAAFNGQGHAIEEIDLTEDWRIIEHSDDAVGLIRQLDEPQPNGPGDLRTHELVRVQRSRGATNVPDGAWVLDQAGTCTPRLDIGGLAQTDLALASQPDADATEIELEVYERACASGEAADGRVEVVKKELTDDALRLVVGVRPRGGDQTCPGNPATALTIDLDEPLGDRTIVDASTLPPQRVRLSSTG